MLKKFFDLDFGLQMIITCFTLIFADKLSLFSLNMGINSSGQENYFWTFVYLVSVLMEIFTIILGTVSIIKRFKK